ncbi:MAG: hypothetical protein ACO1RX_11070 [Candidatus Sericytochromatia bacterium]
MKHLFSALCLMGVCALPAQASSLPKADLSRSSVALGTGPSLALDLALTPTWSLGGTLAMPLFYSLPGVVRYDLRTTALLFEQQGLSLRGVFGGFGSLDPYQRPDTQLSPFGVEAGLAVSYQISDWVTARLNVVGGIGFPYSLGFGLFPPAGGIELAFRPFDYFEATVGFNGNGDILSARYLF